MPEVAPGVTLARSEGTPWRARIAVSRRYDAQSSLKTHRFGSGDPTVLQRHDGFAKASMGAAGPVTVAVQYSDNAVEVEQWGAVLEPDALLGFLGLLDRPDAFVPENPVLRRRAREGLHLARAISVAEQHVVHTLQQRVTWEGAARSWQALIRATGIEAPGPYGLRIASLEALSRLAPLGYRLAGVDEHRGRTVREVARKRRSIDQSPEIELPTRLLLPGIGPWTQQMTLGWAAGDPDAVPVGDVHLPHVVSLAFTGDPRADDARMLELLAPFAGNRFRVLRMLH
jgi:3-methyladenine DNA glycosylase/8-oxoguanine DNA glycosylase